MELFRVTTETSDITYLINRKNLKRVYYTQFDKHFPKLIDTLDGSTIDLNGKNILILDPYVFELIGIINNPEIFSNPPIPQNNLYYVGDYEYTIVEDTGFFGFLSNYKKFKIVPTGHNDPEQWIPIKSPKWNIFKFWNWKIIHQINKLK